MRYGIIGTAVAAAWAFAFPASAQTPGSGEYRIIEENDKFNPFTVQTDRYYTQGLRIERINPEHESGPDFLPFISHGDWCSLVCGDDAKTGIVKTGYAIGQSIYTPERVGISRPQPYDHPWAGYLYASRIAQVSYAEAALKAQRRDRIEFSLGMVGSASLAEDAQIWWHKVIHVDRPAGWANQLHNEPVAQLRYETALRWPQEEGGNVDLVPRLRANLGTALTSLEGDVTARIGWNLRGFGTRSIGMNETAPRSRVGAHLFVRAGGKLVARDLFLDGNTFVRNDIRIGSEVFVPEIAWGAELTVHGVSLGAQFIRRGSEFRSDRGRQAPAQDFGALTLGVAFD